MPDTQVMDILKQVEAGDLTPEQADAALAAVGFAAEPPAATAAAAEPAAWEPRSARALERAAARMERHHARLERRRHQLERRLGRHHHRRPGSSYTVDHLIRLRLYGITPDYVEEIQELLGEVPVETLVEFRVSGVTADLVQELIDSGIESPTADDVLRWRHATRGSRFSDAVSTAMDAVGPHVSQLVEAALAEARRKIYEALRVTPNAPEEWRSVDVTPDA